MSSSVDEGITELRVVVDRSRCEGHGQCQAQAPEVFEVDDDGFATILLDPVPSSLAGRALAGVRACPVVALSAVEAEDRG
jgi:ferredoxin